jgi:uncharacterized membrane protein (UPF0136 family)
MVAEEATMRGGRAGLLCAAALVVSLAVQAWIIITAGLGSEPGPEEVATFFEEYRLGLAIVGLLIIVAVLFFLVLLRGLYSWLGGSALPAFAVATGVLGAASMTVFGAGPLFGYFPPEWIVSNAADVFLGLTFLMAGVVMLQHRYRLGWVSVAMGLVLVIAGVSPVADPHLAQLFVIVWSAVFGLRLVRFARNATPSKAT